MVGMQMKQQWCANCGTVSSDGTCHCTDEFMSPGHKPDWHPYPLEMVSGVTGEPLETMPAPPGWYVSKGE